MQSDNRYVPDLQALENDPYFQSVPTVYAPSEPQYQPDIFQKPHHEFAYDDQPVAPYNQRIMSTQQNYNFYGQEQYATDGVTNQLGSFNFDAHQNAQPNPYNIKPDNALKREIVYIF